MAARASVSVLKKHSIDKQEAIVSCLWRFARDAQKIEKQGCVITAEDGTKLEDKAIRMALASIMQIFGYEVLEVQ